MKEKLTKPKEEALMVLHKKIDVARKAQAIYMGSPMTNNNLDEIGEFEHQTKPIQNIEGYEGDEQIISALNTFINSKKEVCAVISTLVRQCLNSKDYGTKLGELLSLLEEVYPEDNKKYYAIYQECYLESILPSVKIAIDYTYPAILDLYRNSLEDMESIKTANLQIKQALGLNIVMGSFANKDQYADILKDYDLFPVIMNSLKEAYKMDKEKCLIFMKEHSFLKNYFIEALINQDSLSYKDILFSIVNNKILGFYFDENLAEGLTKAHNYTYEMISNKELKNSFEQDLFWKITHSTKEDFNNFVQEQSGDVKAICLLSRMVVKNDPMKYSVPLKGNFAIVKPKTHSDGTKVKPASTLTQKNIDIDKDLNIIDYEDDDFEIIERFNSPNKKKSEDQVQLTGKTGIFTGIYYDVKSQFLKITSILSFKNKNDKDNNDNEMLNSLENSVIGYKEYNPYNSLESLFLDHFRKSLDNSDFLQNVESDVLQAIGEINLNEYN